MNTCLIHGNQYPLAGYCWYCMANSILPTTKNSEAGEKVQAIDDPRERLTKLADLLAWYITHLPHTQTMFREFVYLLEHRVRAEVSQVDGMFAELRKR